VTGLSDELVFKQTVLQVTCPGRPAAKYAPSADRMMVHHATRPAAHGLLGHMTAMGESRAPSLPSQALRRSLPSLAQHNRRLC